MYLSVLCLRPSWSAADARAGAVPTRTRAARPPRAAHPEPARRQRGVHQWICATPRATHSALRRRPRDRRTGGRIYHHLARRADGAAFVGPVPPLLVHGIRGLSAGSPRNAVLHTARYTLRATHCAHAATYAATHCAHAATHVCNNPAHRLSHGVGSSTTPTTGRSSSPAMSSGRSGTIIMRCVRVCGVRGWLSMLRQDVKVIGRSVTGMGVIWLGFRVCPTARGARVDCQIRCCSVDDGVLTGVACVRNPMQRWSISGKRPRICTEGLVALRCILHSSCSAFRRVYELS